MNDELERLRPEVREAVVGADEAFKHTGLFAEPYWQTIRAELLRQAREIADLRDAIVGLGAMRKDAEAELGALKARIAEAPVATLVYGQSDMLSVLSAENADDWSGRLVRLVVEK